MKHLIITAAIGAGLLAAALAPAQNDEFEAYRVGEFKGYEFINRYLAERLLDPQDARNRNFELAQYFGEPFVIPGGLNSLLGGYSGQGTSNDFRNGTPNGVNMLLWHLGFYAFGQALGQVCDDVDGTINPEPSGISDIVLSPVPLGAFQAVCAAGNSQTAQTAALEQVWMAVFAYDLPQREMQAFAEFFATDAAYMSARGQDQIAMAVNGMLLNPLFLLSR